MTKKEKIYHLQNIDCNCNDCGFLERDLNKFNEARKQDEETQLWLFNLKKKRMIDSILYDFTIHHNEEKRDLALKEAESLKFQYTGQAAPISYGRCKKFNKEITFLANICQLETQDCFEHRLDLLSEVEREKKLGIEYRYEFHYIDANVKQRKILISHDVWVHSNTLPEKERKDFLKKHTNGEEWFTDKSPLFDAIATGILNCNGIHKCNVTKKLLQ